MDNEYEIRGDVTAIFLKSPKYGIMETLISTSKLERVKEYPNIWYVDLNVSNNSFYVMGKTRENGKQKKVRIHRWIMSSPDGKVVDHINHDTLNNVDSNLRVVSQSENRQNLKGAYANSESGVRGVRWRKDRNKWLARIRINKILKHVGYFNSLEEAKQAVRKARFKYMPFSMN